MIAAPANENAPALRTQPGAWTTALEAMDLRDLTAGSGRQEPRRRTPMYRPLTKADIWTLREVADLLSVHPSTVRRMVGRGEIPARQFAGRLLFVRDQVEAALRGEWTAA